MVPSADEVEAYLRAQLSRDGLTNLAQNRVQDGKAAESTAFWGPRN